jgi:hypothetical protein
MNHVRWTVKQRGKRLVVGEVSFFLTILFTIRTNLIYHSVMTLFLNGSVNEE